jgi:DNA-binding NarL/FixJ family response regulator
MKILIVDDHVLFREGLKLLLAKLQPQVRTLDADDLEAAIQATRHHADIDLVLLDLGLPGMSGVSALTEFRRSSELPVVVLSGQSDRDTVLGALECGAMGFIPKTMTPDVLDTALKTVLAQGVALPPTLLWASPPASASRPPPCRHLSELGLTARQLQVFTLIVQGRPNKLIARDLGVSESTVKAHVKPILKALNVTSRVGAILEVGRLGILLD